MQETLKTIRDRKPLTATSIFTQFLCCFNVSRDPKDCQLGDREPRTATATFTLLLPSSNVCS